MANTATVYARIEPELKKDVEAILSQLGVTPSSLVQMLYSQIRLTKSIPFEVKIPEPRLISIDELTKQQLDIELQKGIDSIENGRVYSEEDVDVILNREFGI